MIGAPHARTNGVDAGIVVVLPGTSTGPASTTSSEFSQSTPGVPGTPETDDYFGYTLYAAPVHGRSVPDLAVGVVGETTSTCQGLVQLLPGVPGTGLTGTGATSVAQSTTLGGGAQLVDRYGDTIA